MKKLIVGLFMLFVIVAGGGVEGFVGNSDYYILSNSETVPACYIINYLGHHDTNYHDFLNLVP